MTPKVNNVKFDVDEEIEFSIGNFLVLAVALIGVFLYFFFLPFQAFIQMEWDLIKDDWQLLMSFWIFVIVSIGFSLFTMLSYTILHIYNKCEVKRRNILLFRYWLLIYFIIMCCFHFGLGFSFSSYLVYLIGLIFMVCFTILEIKTHFFIRALDKKTDPFEVYVNEEIEFSLSKALIIIGFIILGISIYLNVFGLKDITIAFWKDISSNFLSTFIFFAIILLVFFWWVLEFIGILFVGCAYFFINEETSKYVKRIKIYAITFIILILISRNLPFLPLDELTKTIISMALTLIIYMIAWQFRMKAS